MAALRTGVEGHHHRAERRSADSWRPASPCSGQSLAGLDGPGASDLSHVFSSLLSSLLCGHLHFTALPLRLVCRFDAPWHWARLPFPARTPAHPDQHGGAPPAPAMSFNSPGDDVPIGDDDTYSYSANEDEDTAGCSAEQEGLATEKTAVCNGLQLTRSYRDADSSGSASDVAGERYRTLDTRAVQPSDILVLPSRSSAIGLTPAATVREQNRNVCSPSVGSPWRSARGS